jgi:hypothetical protein
MGGPSVPSSIPFQWQLFRLWKDGHAAVEYEDAGAGDSAAGRFAIADGAAEASFAALWARLLVESFIAAQGEPWRGLAWMGPARQKWAAQVDMRPLPWYAQAKRELGAFAAFLGLAFLPRTPTREASWYALAVGDCCIFHTRGGRLARAYPLARSGEFGNRPRLLCSRTLDAEEPEDRHEPAHGSWQREDCFLLMTDALAQWFLLRTEQGGDPLAEIRGLQAEMSPEDAFPGWVRERRDHSQLRDDDVTLIVVDVA